MLSGLNHKPILRHCPRLDNAEANAKPMQGQKSKKATTYCPPELAYLLCSSVRLSVSRRGGELGEPDGSLWEINDL